MNKVFYVSNISVNAAFRYAHPRYHDPPAILYVFDYASYKISVYNNWQGGKPQKPSYMKVINDCATLIELYDTIISLGKSEPGSVSELHFFTHGDPNTGVTLLPYGEDKYKFNRVIGKDTKRGEGLINAFSSSALIKLWGCSGNYLVQDLTLSYWKTNNKERRRNIQQRVESFIRGMYAWRLSCLLNLTIWSTPIGWSSSMDMPPKSVYNGNWDEQTGPEPNSMWWRISSQFVKGRGAEFYKKILKANLDPVGYVGINDEMSLRPEPAELIKVEANIDEIFEDIKSCPA